MLKHETYVVHDRVTASSRSIDVTTPHTMPALPVYEHERFESLESLVMGTEEGRQGTTIHCWVSHSKNG